MRKMAPPFAQLDQIVAMCIDVHTDPNVFISECVEVLSECSNKEVVPKFDASARSRSRVACALLSGLTVRLMRSESAVSFVHTVGVPLLVQVRYQCSL